MKRESIRQSAQICGMAVETPPQPPLVRPPAPPLNGRSTSILVAADHLADSDMDVLAVLTGVVLWRAAPAAIKQNACRRHACGRWHGLLAYDPGEHLDA